MASLATVFAIACSNAPSSTNHSTSGPSAAPAAAPVSPATEQLDDAPSPAAAPAPALSAQRAEPALLQAPPPADDGGTGTAPADTAEASAPEATPPSPSGERTWRDVTDTDIDVNLVFVDLPPDHGLVTPINANYRPSADTECIRRALTSWEPAQGADPVQRTRNLLMIAGTADLLQIPIERDLPLVVFGHLGDTLPIDQLVKVLYWIAIRPYDGDLNALDALPAACLDVHPPDDRTELQYRVGLYATKLLGRLTGRLP